MPGSRFDTSGPGATDPLDEIIRIEGGQVLATLIRLTGDIDRAEDALQDAALTAAEVWKRDGLPNSPGAWLTTVARHRALDMIRRESRRAPKEVAAFRMLTDAPTSRFVGRQADDSTDGVGDDILRLLFTCCHPALSEEARIALALRTICGLSTVDIARVFVVPDATIGQRISRAKAKIANARIPYRVPPAHELPDRLDGVLRVIYLLFTAGHHAPAGELASRVDLAGEGIRLGRLMISLMPDEPECTGLTALMLATHSRTGARLDGDGNLVLLSDQDRSLWDHTAIAEAAQMVESILRRRRPGIYQIQAAIACLHSLAPSFAETDWPQIVLLYALLEARWRTPIVRVNRAIAVAEVDGPAAGLVLLDELSGSPIERWHLYWSTRADFLRRLGSTADAIDAYRRALACPCNDTDCRFLESRLTSLGTP